MKKLVKELKSIFASEFDSDCAVVSDFEIILHGTLVDFIHIDENDKVSIFAGNPTNDDEDFEELIATESELKTILTEIIENL